MRDGGALSVAQVARPDGRATTGRARALRIAHVAPPLEAVPPTGYGGTERIVHELVTELVRRGHEVTTFGSGDSDVPGRLIPTVPQALRPLGFGGDPSAHIHETLRMLLSEASEFDVVHGHLEWFNPILTAVSPVPSVATFHGRLDFPWARDILLRSTGRFVAISQSHATTHPMLDWAGIVHNGLTLRDMPFAEKRSDALCFVGRIAPEKGVLDAIEIARRSGRTLRMAAKEGHMPHEVSYHEEVFRPAVAAAGSAVEFLGELSRADRDRLFADSYASLMPGSWPEPFGLVAIESLASGTPVIARRVGALPEIIRDGVDGFFGSDVDELVAAVDRVAALDRRSIRDSVLDRFSSQRMADGYEAVYRKVIAEREEPQARGS
jgi:glycosyltransferase involved in cell wall biosynthesis